MKRNKLEACKQDLLSTYKEQLCNESVASIKAAQTPEEFVNILHEFDTFLMYQALPDAEWSRKWFLGEKPLLNKCGVYLDQVVSINNPECRKLILMGDSHVTLTCSTPNIFNISLQECSTLNLITVGVTSVTVREKGTGKANILLRSKQSIIKIHKI